MSSNLERILKELVEELDKNKEPKEEKREILRKPEGYESLISDEEFEAIEKIVDAVDNYIKVHNANTLSDPVKVFKATPYARIQYSALSDFVREMMDKVHAMYDIHSMSKALIDESMTECGETDIEKFEAGLIHGMFMKKMLND